MRGVMRSGAKAIPVLAFIILLWCMRGLGAESGAGGGREENMNKEEIVTFFLCGDVMPGRGMRFSREVCHG
jgi:hypothetical protein